MSHYTPKNKRKKTLFHSGVVGRPVAKINDAVHIIDDDGGDDDHLHTAYSGY